MLDDKSHAELFQITRILQIIVLALMIGVMGYGIYVLLQPGDDRTGEMSLLCYIAVGMGVHDSVLALFIPRILVWYQRKQIAAGTWGQKMPQASLPATDAGRLGRVYQVSTIIGCALLEGPAFLAIIAYSSDGHISMLFVVIIMLIGLALYFPTRGRIERWVEGQLRRIEEDRSLAEHVAHVKSDHD